jgi:hypothetical protein
MELPQQVRSQIEFGNEETIFPTSFIGADTFITFPKKNVKIRFVH